MVPRSKGKEGEGEMSELKPCPFCGELPKLEYGNGIKKYWYVCENEKCSCQPLTYAHKNKGVVTRAWNTRTPKNDEVRE